MPRGGRRPGAGKKPKLRRPVRRTYWMEMADAELAAKEARRQGIGVGRLIGKALRVYVRVREEGAFDLATPEGDPGEP